MAKKAKESKQIIRSREKLEKILNEEKKKLTPEALAKVSQVIRYWIARHQSERINLKEKTIRLFDANKHPEPIHSNYVKHLVSKLLRGG